MDPEIVLRGDTPRLIDEWQEVPPIWDAVRHSSDMIAEKGLYILTGSATPNQDGIVHSGAGRIGRVKMHSMSLFESGDSSGEISLLELFKKPWNKNVFTGKVELEHLIDLTVRGGWPGTLGINIENAMDLSKGYLDAVINKDVQTIDRKKRDVGKMRALIRSLARNESTTVSKSTLAKDMTDADDETASFPTLSDYLDVLGRLYVIEEQPAFNPNLRSSLRVGKTPKRRFTDPSLAIAALEATPEMMIGDLNTYGLMFESLCMRDLGIYAESFGGRLYHYRDGDGREVDAVVELPDGRWGAFEIKLGIDRIDAAAEGLLKINELTYGNNKSKGPAVLCVICGLSSAAYRREDGVFVIPITALRN
jgi:predicted AAA+ superfamily ATPase